MAEEHRPQGEAKQVDLSTHPLVNKYHEDPNVLRDFVTLVGYIGPSNKPDHVRVYADLSFRNYYEVPTSGVVATTPTDSNDPNSPTRVDVNAKTHMEVVSISSQTVEASFLQGSIVSGYMSGVGTTGQAGPFLRPSLNCPSRWECTMAPSACGACSIEVCPTRFPFCNSQFPGCVPHLTQWCQIASEACAAGMVGQGQGAQQPIIRTGPICWPSRWECTAAPSACGACSIEVCPTHFPFCHSNYPACIPRPTLECQFASAACGAGMAGQGQGAQQPFLRTGPICRPSRWECTAAPSACGVCSIEVCPTRFPFCHGGQVGTVACSIACPSIACTPGVSAACGQGGWGQGQF